MTFYIGMAILLENLYSMTFEPQMLYCQEYDIQITPYPIHPKCNSSSPTHQNPKDAPYNKVDQHT